jgi:RNA polymerase sigma-70 factor (ECF subfamily)
VARALDGLPDDQRTVVTLRDVHGLDYREIARMLEIPIGTVESRIARGRMRLRAVLRPPAPR